MTAKKWAVSAILIDLDGTLLNSAPDMIMAANGALGEGGMPAIDAEKVIPLLGKGVEHLAVEVFKAGMVATLELEDEIQESFEDPGENRVTRQPVELTPEQQQAAIQIFKKHYHCTNGRYTEVFGGVLEGLKAFKAAGFKVACVTNKAAEFTEPLLEKTGIAAYMDLIVSGDTTDKKKPDPEPVWYAMKQLGAEKAIMIGDSVNDIQAAKNAGIPAVCMTYGYGGQSSVEADAYAADFISILPMIALV